MYDVIILGGGPAGFTAGIYSVRAGHKTLLLAGIKWGGQLMLTTLVENFPGFEAGIQGPQLMLAMRKQTERLGVEIINNDFTRTDLSKYPFEVYIGEKKFTGKSVIIATGADSIWLNVPGESDLRGKGVSTCATCDAFFFRGKDIIVIGGGDSAMEEALVLSQVAKSVTIIHRRDKFRASVAMQNRVFADKKIKVLWNKVITKFSGTEKLTGVVLKDTTSGKETNLATDGAFVAIGHKPNSDKLKGLDVNAKGYVIKKEIKDENGLIKYSSQTNIPGVFVAGDVNDYRYKQAVTAAGLGCIAALDADRYLQEEK